MAESDSLDEQSREFLYYVGSAITEWAHIDQELFHICAAILKTRQHLVAIIYYRTPTLDARLTLTGELVDSVLPMPERKSGGHPPLVTKAWATLLQDIKLQLPIRNQLAHSPAAPMAEFAKDQPPDGSIAISDIWYVSYTSQTEKMRGRTPRKELKVDDVKAHISDVSHLINRLRDFRLGALPALLK